MEIECILEKRKQVKKINWKLALGLFALMFGFGVYMAITYRVKQQLNQYRDSDVLITLFEDGHSQLTIIIEDPNNQQFALPDEFPFPYSKESGQFMGSYNLNRTFQLEGFFSLDSSISDITLINVTLPSPRTFFLGEGSLSLTESATLPMWMQVVGDQAYVACLKTSAKVEVNQILNRLHFIIHGGKVVFKIFIGDTPQNVITQYHHYVNGYKIMPFWMLGYQYGFIGGKLDPQKFTDNKLPLETVWNQYTEDNHVLWRQSIKIDKSNYCIRLNEKVFYDDDKCYADFNNRKTIEKIQYPKSDGYELYDNSIDIDTKASHTYKYTYLIHERVTEQYFQPLNSIAQASQMPGVQISQQVFFGTGRLAGHFMDFDKITNAIAQTMNLNALGIGFMGVNGCNQGKETLYTCAEWFSLGAWLPLFRTYTDSKFVFNNQDFQRQAYAELRVRYQLLKWMYSQYMALYDHILGAAAGMIYTPTWWNYPNDTKAYIYQDSQFIFADTLLIAPFQKDNTGLFTDFTVYFPLYSNWKGQNAIFTGGSIVSTPLLSATQTPVFQKQGTILAKQDDWVKKTTDFDNQFRLVCYFNSKMHCQTNLITLTNYTDAEITCAKNNCVSIIAIDTQILTITGQQEDTIFEEYIITSIEVSNSTKITSYNRTIIVNGPMALDLQLYISQAEL